LSLRLLPPFSVGASALLLTAAGSLLFRSPPPTPPDPFADLPLALVRELPEPFLLPGLETEPPSSYSEQVRASFQIRVRDLVIPYRVLALTVRPGETLEISLDGVGTGKGAGSLPFQFRTPEGLAPPVTPGRWQWTAPRETGAVPLRIESLSDGDAISLNVLVIHPFDAVENGSMNGFRIGEYRLSRDRSPPPGFIEAHPEVLGLRVAPGFVLRQFLPHQPGNPRYLALSEALLLKLEAVLEEVKASGIEARTLHVMSGFRTPFYNRAIGNTTDASRHLWGDAADIFIDETGNGRMDDLTGNGSGGHEDALLLHQIVERVEARGEPHVRPGGLHIYRANAVRGPFLHVDARGVPARW